MFGEIAPKIQNYAFGQLTTGNPLFAAANGAATTSGIVPIANGGTNNSAAPALNGIIYYDGTRLNSTSVVTMSSAGIALGSAAYGFQSNLSQDRYWLLSTTNGSKIANSGVGTTYSFDCYAGLFTSAGGAASTGQFAWYTVNNGGAGYFEVLTISNSGVVNGIFSTTAVMTTDGSKNLVSVLATTTYTPTIGDGTNNFTTSFATGVYYKVGPIYFVEINLIWTNRGLAVAADPLVVSLPIAVGPSSHAAAAIVGPSTGISLTGSYITSYALSGNAFLNFYGMSNGGTQTAVTVSQAATGGGSMSINIIYWSN